MTSRADHWVRVKVGDLFEIVGGGTPSRDRTDFWDGEIPWISSADIAGDFGLTPRRFVTEAGVEGSATALVPEGSVVVVTRVGLGKVGLAQGSLCFSQDCQALLPVTGLEPRFVAHQMGWLARGFRRVSRGTTVSGITKTQLRTTIFGVPPLGEQHRIVAKIEELFSDLDVGMAALERAQAKLERYQASVLKAAVEGKLTEQWRAENPPKETGEELLRRILAERRKRWEEEQLVTFEAKGKRPPKNWKAKYREPVGPDNNELPELPEGWCWATAATVCQSVDSGSTPRREYLRDDSGTPFIKVQHLSFDGALLFGMTPYYVAPEYHATRMSRSTVQPGDVLTNIVGPPLGKVSLVPAGHPESNVNQAIARFRPGPALAAPFLLTYLQSETAQAWLRRTAKTTTSQVNLAITTCRRLPVPVPPIPEQRVISDMAEVLAGPAQLLTVTAQRGMRQASALRQSILRLAFEGRLVPQNPNDEPAASLLGRIRAEHETDHPRKKRGPKPKAD